MHPGKLPTNQDGGCTKVKSGIAKYVVFSSALKVNNTFFSLWIRQDYRDLLDVMVLADSSSGTSSSSDEDLEVLFLDAAFPETRTLGPHLNLEDVSELDCKRMFR